MKKLLVNPEKYYKPKERPSGHDIGTAFATNNGGAIPANLLQIPNTESNSRYTQLCKAVNIRAHPARFPQKLPLFFINFLTEPGDRVLDIFAGSNTTGAAAEGVQRRWLAFEQNLSYLAASAFRFIDANQSIDNVAILFEKLLTAQETVNITRFVGSSTFT
jgi:site-specific DNA-methyltransferase (cytosine-N4-specific)